MTKKQITTFEQTTESKYQNQLKEGVRLEIEVFDIFFKDKPSVCVRFFENHEIIKKDDELLKITEKIEKEFENFYKV